jgi:DNA-binding CsgD family transcriptional regulator
VLLERDRELASVDAFLADIRGGKGRVLAVVGPPGIGKTALLGEIEERAAPAGIAVLHARPNDLDRGLPFGVARQLLERRVRAATQGEAVTLLEGAAGDALGPLGIADVDPAGHTDLRSLHGLHWLAANLAGRQPLLLCVDDAHWADRTSMRWLLYMAPRIVDLSLGVAIATRTSEPGSEQDVLDALLLDDATTVVEPRPLTASAVSVLMSSALPAATAPGLDVACHHSTGGNPLLVSELLRELAAAGEAPTTEQLNGYGIEAVARYVRRRLHALDPNATSIARAVAVIGDGATPVDVAAMCGLDEGTVRSVAVELVGTQILASDMLLGFVHPLVRAAVYGEMAPVQRAALHRRAAQLLEVRGASENAAVHLLQVDPRGDPHAVKALCDAGAAAAANGAPEAAATFLRRALAEPPEPGASRASVLAGLGAAEALARVDGFDDHLRRAIGETTDVEQRAELALSLGRALTSLGDAADAFELMEAALEAVGRERSVGPMLEAELLAVAHASAELRPRVASRALHHIERLERGEVVDPMVHGALSPWLLERPAVERAVEAAESALADPRLNAGQMDTLVVPVIGYTLLGAGRIRRAGDVFDAAIARAERRGEVLIRGVASALRSDVCLRGGEVVKAEGDARVAWECAVGDGLARASQPLPLVVAGGVLVNALVTRGHLEEAQGYVDRMPDPLPLRCELFLPARAELRLAQGRLDDAIADLRAVGELLGEEFYKPIQNWRARLAVALARAGEHEEARALAAAELRQAQRWGVPLALGVAYTAAGVVEGGPGGVALLERAVALLARTEGRLDHALALIELGALLRRQGSRAVAREPLRAGMDLAARCGATAHADRAHAELITAGARPRRDRRFLTGPESLTASELRVASLAAEGLTDRAIAQRLYVTQSAVRFHMRNTFRKLGIGARADLAAALDSPATDAES